MSRQITQLTSVLAQAREAVNLGQFDEARHFCHLIFDIDPGHLGGLQTYMSATKIAPDDAVFARLQRYSTGQGLPDAVQSQLHFMIGKGLGDMGAYQAAFEAFVTANGLKPVTFDVRAKAEFAKRLISAVDAAPVLTLEKAAPRMIFVLGMPRSGTSLVAQALAAHPGLSSLGEMTALGPALTQINGKRASLIEFIHGLSLTNLKAARQAYVSAIPQAALKSGRVLIDKMPENYWLAWVLPMIFPDALVIHSRREQLATCWSCFRNDFGAGHEYSYDFDNLMTQYNTHLALTAAWKAQAPMQWRELWLSHLIDTPRATLEPLLAAVGLPWDDACLHPEAAKGPVKTLSKWQVRRGINANIAQEWQNYLPFIRYRWHVDEADIP